MLDPDNDHLAEDCLGKAETGDPVVDNDREYIAEQTGFLSRPVEHYRAIWGRLNAAVADLHCIAAERDARLKWEIEDLIAVSVLSVPTLQSAAAGARAGDRGVWLQAITPEAISLELETIDKKYGAGTEEALDARLRFLHLCFAHSLRPEILKRIEVELDDLKKGI
jgi:hypothetical protein